MDRPDWAQDPEPLAQLLRAAEYQPGCGVIMDHGWDCNPKSRPLTPAIATSRTARRNEVDFQWNRELTVFPVHTTAQWGRCQ